MKVMQKKRILKQRARERKRWNKRKSDERDEINTKRKGRAKSKDEIT